jgi:hypothetical protein
MEKKNTFTTYVHLKLECIYQQHKMLHTPNTGTCSHPLYSWRFPARKKCFSKWRRVLVYNAQIGWLQCVFLLRLFWRQKIRYFTSQIRGSKTTECYYTPQQPDVASTRIDLVRGITIHAGEGIREIDITGCMQMLLLMIIITVWCPTRSRGCVAQAVARARAYVRVLTTNQCHASK